jgi:hypothetical protein
MFCSLNGQHYALTCFHVGCATDENRLNTAFNKVEDVQKMRNSLSAYESYAKKQQYYFTQGNTKNDNEPILFGDDGTDCTRLGSFDNYHFDNECDILSLKVLDGVKIDCKIAGLMRGPLVIALTLPYVRYATIYLRVLRLNVRMKKVNVKMDGKIKINWNVKKNGLFFRKKVRAIFRRRKWREKKKQKVRATFR